jgi:hypothetical protein
MIYKIYKEAGRIGTGMEKTEGSLMDSPNSEVPSQTRIHLAAFDDETNTIHVFNDKIFDVSSLVQKFKNQCNLPNNHQFNIQHK